MDISYREIYAMNKEEARKQLVNSYLTIRKYIQGSFSLAYFP